MRIGIVAVLLAASGCATSGVAAWHARVDAVRQDASPSGKLLRSELLYEGVTEHTFDVYQGNAALDEATRRGLALLFDAAAAEPRRPAVWSLFERWRRYLGSSFDAPAGSRLVCAAADRVQTFALGRLCGDVLWQARQRAEALARWRSLLRLSPRPDQRWSILARLDEASLDLAPELTGLSPPELDALRRWERARDRREAALLSARICRANCHAQFVQCRGSLVAWATDSCDRLRSSCRNRCSPEAESPESSDFGGRAEGLRLLP